MINSDPRAPSLAQLRRDHAIALGEPMLGIPMAGDPHFSDGWCADRLRGRRICQYAAALLRRDPTFGDDLSGLFADVVAPDRVLFRIWLRGREQQDGAVVAEVTLPHCGWDTCASVPDGSIVPHQPLRLKTVEPKGRW